MNWKNWKTTVSGLVGAGAGLVLYLQMYIHEPAWLVGIASFAAIGGFATIGLSAKDFNVTGGSVGQPSTSQALHDANQEPHADNPPKS
jgi:hypothetical protein